MKTLVLFALIALVYTGCFFNGERCDQRYGCSYGCFEVVITVTNISQERTNQEKTKIGPFFHFLLHFSILLPENMHIASYYGYSLQYK